MLATQEPEASAEIVARPDLGRPRVESTLAAMMLVLGISVALFSMALTVRAYMPCPWQDGWEIIADIASGAKPWSWHWLWSQHSEHRIVTTRLLVWLDWAVFGGKNVSLFVEIYLVQILHWAAICFVLERFTDFSKSLRRTVEGLFAYCLFHPNQAQNLTWAFQISFILCFALGTSALLAIAFFEKAPARLRWLILLGAGLAPIIAATNLASGLLIGPAVVCLAFIKRLPRRALLMLVALSLLSILVYFCDYHTPVGHSSPLQALLQPLNIFRYVLVFLNVSWPSFSHAGISLVCFAACATLAAFHRESVSGFEWFCIAECGLMLATALVTACGRLQYGVLQAAESRYQTPAMIYWASLFSLLLIMIWRRQPARFSLAQLFVFLVASTTLPFLPSLWRGFVAQADQNRLACVAVFGHRYSPSTSKRLNSDSGLVARGVKALRHKWTY